MDNLLYTSFVSKFNEKYESALLEEQKTLLSYYISSFTDNSLELKTFLNEEILRLRSQLEEALKLEDIANDQEMVQKTEKVIAHLDGFKRKGVDEDVLKTVLKTQQLVKEIFENGSRN